MKQSRKLVAGAIAAFFLALAAWWFQPWRLFTNTEVIESLPAVSETHTTAPTGLADSGTSPPSQQDLSSEGSEDAEGEGTPEQPTETFPTVLYSGSLISHEYETSGTVQILELADGSRILRLEGLQTSDGPDLEIWLSDAPVIPGRDGWFLFDDGDYFSLGKLKGNLGDQNYEIPADLDLERFSSMSIWCVRFAVSFGAAELVKPTQ